MASQWSSRVAGISGTEAIRALAVSNDAMRAAVPVALAILALGCSSRQNTNCRWPEELPRPLDLRVEDDVAHLMRDVELAEELSVRFADASGIGPGLGRSRHRLEGCFEPLVAGITSRHSVTRDDVRAAQARIGRRGLNPIVNGPVAVLFSVLTWAALIRLRRRFPDNTERGPLWVAMAILAVAVSGLSTGVGKVWQMISETIRIGNGHLGGERGLRLPWNQHAFDYFLIMLVAFLLIAAWSRMRQSTPVEM